MAVTLTTRVLLTALMSFQAVTQLVQGQDHVQLVSGDVMLAAMFGVNTLEGDGCGAYDINILKRTVAVTWFLDALNSVDYFGKGVRLGLTAYRTCQYQGRAMTHAVDIVNEFHVLAPPSAPSASSTASLLGLLGPDRTEEVNVVSRFLSSLPAHRRPLQISPSATGEALADRALYSNLFRVIPPDSIQVQVLLELLKALHWNYIAIIYDDQDYGRMASDRLRRLVEKQNICVAYHSQIPLDSRTEEFSVKVNAVIDVVRDKLIKGVVFIGNRATAKEFLIKMQYRVLFTRFIFSEAVGLQDSVFRHLGGVLKLSKGAFVLTPPARPLPHFKEYWNALWNNRTLFLSATDRNPWLGAYFSQLIPGCTAQDDQCWTNSLRRRPFLDNHTRWLFEYYNIKAVAVFAALLKKLVTMYCPTQPVQGLCPRLRQILMNERQLVQKILQTTSFDLEKDFAGVTSALRNFTSVHFDDEGEIVHNTNGTADALYDVYNFQRCQHEQFCFMKVGSLTGEDALQLNTTAVRGYGETGQELTSPNLPKAQCSESAICAECLPSDIANEIIMVPGDFYFVAVAPAYGRDRQNVLECGAVRTSSGVDMIQSVLYSLQQVNAEVGGVFQGQRKLGVIVLNSCYRELVMKRKLIELYQGTLQLPDGRNSTAILPNVAGYIGAYYSTISVAMYEVLSKLTSQFVLLSPTNSSPNLSDRRRFPLYMRMITKSNDQARVMLDIVRRLNASYVQVIYDPTDEYSSGLMEAVNELSYTPPFNICVIQNVNISYDDDSLDRVRHKILQYSWVPVVIVLLHYEHVRNFTNVVTTAIKPRQFVFIGSETWERQQELIDPVDGREKRLEGSFVLYQGLPEDRKFDDYFKKLDPFRSINPWLKYFWEAAGDCYFEDSFEKKGKTPCPVGPSGDLSALTADYVQSVWVPFYINAVKVFAEGLHTAMMDRCQSLTLCEDLTAEDLIRSLKEVRMDLTGSRQKRLVFDANGDGGLGYDVYQVQRQAGKLVYVNVGTYLNGTGSLVISPPYPATGHCLVQEHCQHCFPATSSGDTCRLADEDSFRPAFLTVLVILIVVLVVCGIVLGLHFIRRRCRRCQAGTSRMQTPSPSLRSLQSHDPSEMTPVPESGGEFRRLHSTPSSACSVCALAAGSIKEESPYEDIPHSSSNLRLRRQDATVWTSGAASTLPSSPPTAPSGLRRFFSEPVCHEEYVPPENHPWTENQTEQQGLSPGAFNVPDLIFANELSGGSRV